MSVYKSKFQPVMERWSLVLKIVLLTTGLMFLLRTFMLQSLQDQIASLLLGTILVSIYIYMLIVIPSFICLEKDQLVIKECLVRNVFRILVLRTFLFMTVFKMMSVISEVMAFGVYRCNGQYPLWEILFLCKESQSTNFILTEKRIIS